MMSENGSNGCSTDIVIPKGQQDSCRCDFDWDCDTRVACYEINHLQLGGAGEPTH